MTVATTSTSVTYAGTGAATSFGFTYAVPAGTPAQVAENLVVTVIDAGGATSIVAYGSGPTEYQIVLNPLEGVNPTPTGGQVLYNPLGVPLPVGSTITIERVIPDVQPTSFVNQGTLWQPVVEQSFDYLTMMAQQFGDTVSRAVHGPASDPPGINYTLPPAGVRAGQTLFFDGSGNVTTGVPAPGFISAPMVPVVGAASLADARTAMGLGSIATQNTGNGLLHIVGPTVVVNFPLVADTGPLGVDPAYHMTQRVTQAQVDYFLPLTNNLWNGFGFRVFAQHLVVFHPQPGDSIAGAPVGQTVSIPQDSQIWITTDSVGAWYISLEQQVAIPGGYLTAATDGLIPLASVIDTPNIYYRAALNNYVPIFTGSLFIQQQFDDTLQLQLDPVNHPAGQIYDVFAFMTGVVSIATGPAWRQPGVAITGATNASPIAITTALPHNLLTGDLTVVSGVEGNNAANGRWIITVVDPTHFTLDGSTGDGVYIANTGLCASRGNGAGTSALSRIAGVYVNTVAIDGHTFGLTFPIPAGQATYLGSIYTDQNAAVTCRVAAGNNRIWGVWNAYNRQPIRLIETDQTATWNYAGAPFQVARADTNNKIVLVVGLAEEIIEFTYEAKSTFQTTLATPGTGGGGRAAVWITATGAVAIAPSGFVDDKAAWNITATAITAQLGGPQNFHARAVTRPLIGLVQASPIQSGNAAGTGTISWFGTENNMLFGARWNG